ncbi:hypothetical protein [Bosea sp. (in: a-proteobacteria)]|uniref:hypothetical protein n=1 Tax=Bosea sp. (in: a-proteobacteria) TaxID=1871050 RepID=UPI002736B449|nr:hypothetical protein [Bosea sp. (in: a-proteobacteria)]MDP3256994.1 hypothetical protein [Bosea sp. (in: a-proteobacteria)]
MFIVQHTGLQAQASPAISAEDGQIICRAWQIRVERTLRMKEEYKIVSEIEARRIRGELVNLETQCKDFPSQSVLARYAEVDRLLYDDAEDGF